MAVGHRPGLRAAACAGLPPDRSSRRSDRGRLWARREGCSLATAVLSVAAPLRHNNRRYVIGARKLLRGSRLLDPTVIH